MDKARREEIISNIKTWAAIAVVAIGPGIVGGLIVKKCMVGGLDQKSRMLDKTLEEARSMIDNLSGKVDKAVQSVYATEAKAAFEKRLASIDGDDIATMAKKMVKANVGEALDNAVEKAISRDTVTDAIKDYISDNASYFDRKISRSISDLIDDDDLVDAVSDAVLNAVKEH